MNRLGEKSLKTLEYYEILERLAAQAASEAAKEKCRALRPLDDREQAELWMRQTTDAKDRMVRQGSPSFGGIREVGAILIRADRGGTLNPRELLSVASLLQTARRALAYEAESEEKSALSPIFGLLSGNRSLEEAITTAIVSEEEIADGASPELLSIRRELRRISGRVRETLNRMISGERSKYLQETIITQRNGRFVVPVKAEHRGDVPGLVHDTSSTGATVFVEPQQVVEINNQIKVLEGREEAEIERILASLSAEVSMYKGAIEQDYDALTTLDFIFARAKLSFEMNAAAPSLLESGSRVRLLRARHPLLDKDKAVAIDIAIGDESDELVVLVDDGHAARVVCRHELDDLVHGRAGKDGKGIAIHGIRDVVLRLDGHAAGFRRQVLACCRVHRHAVEAGRVIDGSIAGGLHLAGPDEDFHEITGSFADHLESLVGRRFKICLLHRCL